MAPSPKLRPNRFFSPNRYQRSTEAGQPSAALLVAEIRLKLPGRAPHSSPEERVGVWRCVTVAGYGIVSGMKRQPNV